MSVSSYLYITLCIYFSICNICIGSVMPSRAFVSARLRVAVLPGLTKEDKLYFNMNECTIAGMI
jgi:hypothetical protein